MSDYNNYDFTISISELAEKLKDAHCGGYPVHMVINGMYYDIDFSEKEQGDKND